MNINIIGTGSSGNAILFDDSVLLDTGLPFKELEAHASKIKIVLLTHQHGDHLNKTTVRKLHIANNDIKFCCGDFIHKNVSDIGIPEEQIITVERGEYYRNNEIIFSPVSLYHDVPNFGYRIIKGAYKHFHATDTAHLQGISCKDYDSATVECNHERTAALQIIEEKAIEGDFCHLKRAIETHLSVDKAVDFIISNNIKDFYPVHMGSSTQKEVMKYLDENITYKLN